MSQHTKKGREVEQSSFPTQITTCVVGNRAHTPCPDSRSLPPCPHTCLTQRPRAVPSAGHEVSASLGKQQMLSRG